MNTIKTAAQLREACSANYQLALAHTKHEFRNKGVFRSRGRWIRVIAGEESLVDDGHLAFDGTQKQLDKVLAEYMAKPEVTAIYIEGGIDWSESVQAMNEYDYQPWAGEWTVTVWIR